MSPPIQRPQSASQALLGQAETGEEQDGGLVMSDSSLGPSLWIWQEPAHLPQLLWNMLPAVLTGLCQGHPSWRWVHRGASHLVMCSGLSPIPHKPPAVLSVEAQGRGCTFPLPGWPSVHLPLPPAKNVGSSLHTEDKKKQERDQRESE